MSEERVLGSPGGGAELTRIDMCVVVDMKKIMNKENAKEDGGHLQAYPIWKIGRRFFASVDLFLIPQPEDHLSFMLVDIIVKSISLFSSHLGISLNLLFVH